MASVFRKTALERISSPEQLDKMLRVTPPMGFLAVAAAALMALAALVWAFFGAIPSTLDSQAMLLSPAYACGVFSGARGTVENLYVKENSPVTAGQVLADIALSTGECETLFAPCDGTVGEICLKKGEQTLPGACVARITPRTDASLAAVCFLTPADAAQVRAGMQAVVSLEDGTRLPGTVLCVDTDPTTPEALCAIAGESQAAQIGAPVTLAVIGLEAGDEHDSVLDGQGRQVSLRRGAQTGAQIILRQSAPIALAFPMLSGE